MKWNNEEINILTRMANDGYSAKDIADKLNRQPGHVRARASDIGLKITGIKSQTQHIEKTNQVKEIQTELAEYKKKAEIAGWVDSHKPKKFAIKKKGKKREATAFCIASDWHIEETVLKESVYGLNEFNIDIARSRASHFFTHSVELVKMFERDVIIREIVLALLGDLISGYIHEELQETNSMSPTFAIAELKEMLTTGIQYMLDNTDKKILVPCSIGNHGRTTQKPRHSSAIQNSFEWLLYKMLYDHFEQNERVNIVLPVAYHTFLPIYDKTIRLHHGDAVKFGGGIGGITIPLNKAIGQWDKAKRADLDILGHFHQHKTDRKFVVNGSLIGFNPFAIKIKADYEPPSQSFFLFDSEYGAPTIQTPIFLD